MQHLGLGICIAIGGPFHTAGQNKPSGFVLKKQDFMSTVDLSRLTQLATLKHRAESHRQRPAVSQQNAHTASPIWRLLGHYVLRFTFPSSVVLSTKEDHVSRTATLKIQGD